MRFAGTCSETSRALGEPLAGTAPHAKAWLLVEQAGPWGAKALRESRLPAEIGGELERRGKELGIKVLLVKKPSSANGATRCFAAWCEPGAGRLESLELESPAALLDVDLDALARGEPVGGTVEPDPLYMVCTNAKRDACCARLGRPVLDALRALRPGQVLECSHLGGHRFAANVVCLPAGLCYGRVAPDDATALLDAHEAGLVVPDRLRGRSCYPPEAQAAEVAVREHADMLGVHALRLVSVEPTSETETVVAFASDSGSWHVDLRREAALPPRIESCGKEELASPDVWHVIGLRRLERSNVSDTEREGGPA